MKTRILIVGSGMGGTIVANGLARNLSHELRNGDASLTILGTTNTHLYQPGLLYVPFGRAREIELSRNERSILDRRVNFILDPAKLIDVEHNCVECESGKIHRYDYIIIATGSRLVPEMIPGLKEGAHHFYDLEGARKTREAIDNFEGGRVVININVPHKCPVAPLEITLMLDEHLSERGLRDKSEIIYTYPIGRLHGLEPVAHWALPEFDRRGIQYETFFNTKEVDPVGKTISSEEGDTLSYDLLITIPPHKGAAVVEASGLGPSGWIPTDPKTLLMKGSENVFVVGDTTDIPISKAGSTAHFEADTVIQNITHLVQEGRWARQYDGKVFCFIETGLSSGTYIWFNYETPPKPTPPTQMVHWAKLAYNRMYWLSAGGLL
ncbi:MAG: NAD(P)/FAD-dependent oxidoreductase [Rhodospirillales bacterium]|nr:NAD(P)/FAD-dependent oxidoreductase [Rhodospirillales bacterium]